MATNTLVQDGTAASRILRVLEDEGRKFTWLADASGIPRSTLRFQLKTKPERLTVRNLLSIADALGRKPEEIVSGVEL
jgi:DNA-binding Xre family transcriptional regulator